eukprot:CAMPEP_0184715902 /NCGR_PEP_ID=MMETSP0314-20130426/5765_1 /TAXON_ID=38298 /ORGANISM="Rhodella maculata, Strain CCMP 736" /LENGTH=113 /DNA_ID=CAMNT_0027179189 /DNA_START=786 /DNA_END=1127 /DNA_ORIENTATION=+
MVARITQIVHKIQQLHPTCRHHAPLRGRYDPNLLLPWVHCEGFNKRTIRRHRAAASLAEFELDDRDFRIGDKLVSTADYGAFETLDVDFDHEDVPAVDAVQVVVYRHQRDPQN